MQLVTSDSQYVKVAMSQTTCFLSWGHFNQENVLVRLPLWFCFFFSLNRVKEFELTVVLVGKKLKKLSEERQSKEGQSGIIL